MVGGGTVMVDGMILLWQQSEKDALDEESLETWKISCNLRGTSELYDLAWSPCSQYILSACLDNSIRVFSVNERMIGLI